MNTQFNSIQLIDRTQSGATNPGQSGLGSDDNKGVLHIPHWFRITGTSPSDYLESYIRTLGGWVGSYLSAEKQLLYSTTPVNWSKS